MEPKDIVSAILPFIDNSMDCASWNFLVPALDALPEEKYERLEMKPSCTLSSPEESSTDTLGPVQSVQPVQSPGRRRHSARQSLVEVRLAGRARTLRLPPAAPHWGPPSYRPNRNSPEKVVHRMSPYFVGRIVYRAFRIHGLRNLWL